jgi:hypothetical protein
MGHSGLNLLTLSSSHFDPKLPSQVAARIHSPQMQLRIGAVMGGNQPSLQARRMRGQLSTRPILMDFASPTRTEMRHSSRPLSRNRQKDG